MRKKYIVSKHLLTKYLHIAKGNIHLVDFTCLQVKKLNFNGHTKIGDKTLDAFSMGSRR